MRINKVAISGADDNTPMDKLIEISNEFDFLELGILFSKTKVGTNRYPSAEYIGKLSTLNNLSAHFCGWWSREVIENKNFDLISNLQEGFKRVQLNYSFRGQYFDLTDLINYFRANTRLSLILPYNKGNAPTMNDLMHSDIPSNIHLLYDSSGGRGTEITVIEKPLNGRYTGYAGGINPDNIESIAIKISSVDDNTLCYLDLESGARTNDVFDLTKVRDMLIKSKPFI